MRYGADIDNSLVAIEDVPSGRTHLKCPYCGSGLTAKKGRIKEHHFAHTEKTCWEVQERHKSKIPTLPLYDNFNIQLSGKDLEELKRLWERYGKHNYGIPNYPVCRSLERASMLRWNEYRRCAKSWGAYEFTKLGKIPVGGLSLNLFNSVQEPLLLEKLQELELKALDALGITAPEPELPVYLTDLRLYRTQLRRVLAQTLYYLEVQADAQTFYKVGVTTRPIKERIAQLHGDLRKHFQTVTLKVLGTWAHRGNVEKYFKYRYVDFNYPIGSLTEYYKFNDLDEAKAALRDLRRMKPKVLSEVEQDILSGKPSLSEQAIEEEKRQEKRSRGIRVGMQRAAHWGMHIGRPTGAETEEEFLAKPSSLRVMEALSQGLSLRKAAEKAQVSVNTMRKVKAVLEQCDRLPGESAGSACHEQGSPT